MRTLVVSSTQPRHPIGSLPWVRASLAAVAQLAREGNTLITSFGTSPWDLVLCRAAVSQARVHVIAPAARGSSEQALIERLSVDYGLLPERATWEVVPSSNTTGRGKDAWERRDRAAFAAADKIFPVCVRPDGRIDSLLREHVGKVDDRFRVEWQGASARDRGWNLNGAWQAPPGWPQDAVLHLTRSTDGPWPGEPMHSYWRDVVESDRRYPRDGFSTLCRILEEGVIRGSRFRIRGGAITVSLTALDPSRAVSLFRWRSRYARYSFEPYAVAIARDALIRLGGRPVHYDDGAPSGRADPFSQGRGAGAHWEAEQEWRVEGSLALADVGHWGLAALVPSEEEADALRARFPGLVVGLFGGTQG